MLTLFQAVILGLVQGATELFPVSSLGHDVILPSLFGWSINQTDPFFLAFLVATHLATALVLLAFFYKDWLRIISGIFRSLKERQIDPADHYAKIGWLIVVATVPAGILGLLFEEKLQSLFALPLFAAVFLFLNGLMLIGIEYSSRVKSSSRKPHNHADSATLDDRISHLSWVQSVKIGFFQCLALIPGFSRTGATLSGGIISGLDREEAARFSFLLATPIIAAAALLKLPELAVSGEQGILTPLVVGFIAAALAAFLSVRFLSRYLKTHKLTPFGIYCIVFSLIAVSVSLWRS